MFIKRKFFGQPKGAPAKQSKLSFSSQSNSAKASTKSTSPSEENEDVEMKDEESDVNNKNLSPKEEETDSKPEVKKEKGMQGKEGLMVNAHPIHEANLSINRCEEI